MTEFGQEILEQYRASVDDDTRRSRFDASSKDAFTTWQTRARATLAEILGKTPRSLPDLHIERTVVEETDDYVRERVIYRTRPDMRVPAYLLTPKRVADPVPAVLCLHGHSGGGKDECLDPDSAYAGFARRFAERGLVAFCPDQIGFGERRLPEGKVTYNTLVHGLNMLGQTLIGWRYWDLLGALAVLDGLDTVRSDRIGVMGLSLGGEMTMFLAAMQKRIAAACVSCYLTSHRSTFLDRPHCACGHLRDLALHFEHVDIAALICPRPLFVEAGRADPSFPHDDAEAIVEELRVGYDLFDAPESSLRVHSHDGGHAIDGAQSVPWMVERLRA